MNTFNRASVGQVCSQSGFSLVEILVSLLVLAIGIIGAIKMHVAAMQSTQQQIYTSSAMLLVSELTHKMQGNPAQMQDEGSPFLKINFQATNAKASNSRGCFDTDCGTDQLAAADIAEWLGNVTDKLPNARAVVCLDDEPWNEAQQRFNWECRATGSTSTAVIKLGWADKSDQEQQAAPRLVIPVPSR